MKSLKKVLAVALSVAILGSSTLMASAATTKNKDITLNKTPQITVNPSENKEEKEKNYAEGEAIVMLKEIGVVSTGAKLSDTLDVSSSIKVDDVNTFSDKRDGCTVVSVSSKKLSTEKLIEELKKDDSVLMAEPNYICHASKVTVDAYSDFQWGLENKGQNGGKADYDINPKEMWSKSYTAKKQPVVAVIDTGVDYTHEDLKNKMWVNPYENRLAGKHGMDFSGENKDGAPMDNNGHGTHCAGIIAGEQNNNKGISGVSQNTKIMALKFLDSGGSGYTSNAISCYNYIYRAMKLGVNVVAINDSWGSEENSQILVELINKVGKLGAISVCAAGNSSVNYDPETPTPLPNPYYDDDFFFSTKKAHKATDINVLEYPACNNSKYIISVAATDEKGKIAMYSNYGKDMVDVAAPGTDILSSVCYDNYLPAIYDSQRLNSTTSAYITKDFDARTGSIKTGKGTASFTEVTDEYFTDASNDNHSLKVNVKNAKMGDYYSFEVRYKSKGTQSNPTLGMMLKSVEIPEDDSELALFMLPSALAVYDSPVDEKVTLGDVANVSSTTYVYSGSDSWETNNFQMNDYNPEPSERKLTFVLSCMADGDYTFMLDDIGLSKGVDGEEKSFGKYDVYSGTSMACPAVVGEIALMREKDSSLDLDKTIEKVRGAVSQSDGELFKVDSNGTIDLSKVDSPVPTISSVKLSGSNIVVSGKNFNSNSKILVDNKELNTKFDSKKNTLTASGSTAVNKPSVVVKATNDSGYDAKKVTLLSGKKYTEKGFVEEDILTFDTVSDGKSFYTVDKYGYNIVKYSQDKKKVFRSYNYYYVKSAIQKEKRFKEFINSSPFEINIYSLAYFNNYLYFVVECNLTGESTDKVYATKTAVVKVSVSSKPKYTYYDVSDQLYHPALAVYGNEMYIIGGYNRDTKTLSNAVYKYSNKKWNKVSSLPSGRAMGKCVEVKSKLVYTLGTDGTDAVPQNLIYDGKKWTVSKAPKLSSDQKNTVTLCDNDYTYYDGNVDYISGGVLYTGIIFNGKGDTIKYDVNSDKFSSLNYYFHSDTLNHIYGVVIDDMYYGVAYENRTYDSLKYDEAFQDYLKEDEWYDEDEEDYDDYFSDIDYDEEYEEYYTVPISYTFNVKSGLYNVKASSSNCKVSGTGSYLPNSTVTVKATPNKGYKVKSITVNGKTYNKSSVSFKITKNTTVKVKCTSLVTKIKLNKTKATLNKGDTLKLKATVSPSKAKNKSIKWTTDKKKVATVNSKGVVKAVEKGKAVIKATAKDGSKTSASCKVTVK